MCKKEDIINLEEQFIRVWNDKKIDLVDEIFTPDAVYSFGELSYIGREEIKQYVHKWEEALKDLHISITERIIEDNKSAHLWIGEGKFALPVDGLAPTNSPIRYSGVTFLKVSHDLKIASAHTYSDLLYTLMLTEKNK